MLSYLKSIELISRLLKGKREKMKSEFYVPQKPVMPKKRNPQPLERVSPESQGVPSAYLEKFYKAMSKEEIGCHGIMIARHGKRGSKWKILPSGIF